MRKRKLVFGGLGLLVIAIVLTFALWPKEKRDIEIGAVLPLTGSAAVWGQNAKMGMDLAVQEVNGAGGIKRRRIVILYEDSQSDPKTATSALQKLISSDRVQMIVGDIASSSVLAMAPIAERNHVVLLSPGASNPDISDAGDFIFRNWQSDALEGAVDARYAYSNLRWKRVACLYVNNAYGAGLTTVFAETFAGLGGEIVARESFPQGATDLKAQINRIAAAQPDGIFLAGYPPEMATALKQMAETGVRAPILSVQAFDDPEILERAGQAAEGVIFSVPKPPDPANPVVSNFRSKYQDAYGKEPGVTSDTGYDAVKILAWAVEQGASTGPEVRKRLEGLTDFPGAAGLTSFDSHGDVVRDFIFRTIRGGKTIDADK